MDIMRGMNSESVDLIYLDPPFNSNANYAAPIGSKAAGAEFKDTWGLDDLKVAWHGLIKSQHPALYSYLAAVKDIHSPSMMAYLIYMAVRIMEMKRLLKPTGSIYLHCDPTASHYLKILMDQVFGNGNFQNEIVWGYRTGGVSKRWWARKHDVILFYRKTKYYNHNPIQERIYYEKPFFIADVDEYGRHYADVYIRDVWDEIKPLINLSKERLGYPTQKPLTLLERIIKASSNEGDIVLDPFCGCATTCVAADGLGRQWIGIDISAKAAELVQYRIDDLVRQIVHRTDIPQRTDMEHIRRYNHPENKQILYGKQCGFCAGCGEHFQMRHLEIDHIQPRSRGGTDHMDNLQLLCGSCNRIKGDRPQEYLMSVLNDKDIVKFAA